MDQRRAAAFAVEVTSVRCKSRFAHHYLPQSLLPKSLSQEGEATFRPCGGVGDFSFALTYLVYRISVIRLAGTFLGVAFSDPPVQVIYCQNFK
jgi:hypothetical protein